MFKHKKGLSISLLASLALLSSFAEAVVPNAPGAYIGVTDIDKTSVRVNFLDNADNEDGFLLFDKSGDINVTIPENNETASSQTYVTLTGLTCGRVYTLKALAFNSDGYSEMSDSRSFNIHSTFGVDCNGTNKAPVANAGADQNITFGESVTLDASKSSDSDGAIVSYSWKDSNGKNIEDKEAIVTVDNLSIGTHTFTVTVTDDEDETASDSMKVIVKPKDPIDLEKGLMAHYEFEGNADDSSGNGNDGEEHGGVSYVDGVIGQAGTFDGINDYISIRSNNSLNITKSITMSAWIYIDKYSSSWAPILTKGDTSSMNSPYALLVYKQKLEIALNRNLLHLKENNIPNKEWTHIAITWDGSIIRYFVNGIEQNDTRNFNNSLSVINDNLTIGKDAPGSTEWFSGEIDELRLYNRALNEAEIKELYKLGQIDSETILLGSKTKVGSLSDWGTPNDDGSLSISIGKLTGTIKAFASTGEVANVAYDNSAGVDFGLGVYANGIGNDLTNEIELNEKIVMNFNSPLSNATIGFDSLYEHFNENSAPDARVSWVAYNQDGNIIAKGKVSNSGNADGDNNSATNFIHIDDKFISIEFTTISPNNINSNFDIRYLEADVITTL